MGTPFHPGPSGKRITTPLISARLGQVAQLVYEGLRNKEIASALGLSEGTVKVYTSRLFKAAEVTSRVNFAAWWRARIAPKPRETFVIPMAAEGQMRTSCFE